MTSPFWEWVLAMRSPILMGFLGGKLVPLFWISWLGASSEVISLGPEPCLGPWSLLGGWEKLSTSLPELLTHSGWLVGRGQHRLGCAHSGLPWCQVQATAGQLGAHPCSFSCSSLLTVIYGLGNQVNQLSYHLYVLCLLLLLFRGGGWWIFNEKRNTPIGCLDVK